MFWLAGHRFAPRLQGRECYLMEFGQYEEVSGGAAKGIVAKAAADNSTRKRIDQDPARVTPTT